MSAPPVRTRPSTADTSSAYPSPAGGSSMGMPPARTIPSTYTPCRTAASASQTPKRVGSRYVVSPIRGLEPFEATDPLPFGDRRIERGDFDARGVQVVLDDVVAEGFPGELALTEQRRRLAQGRGHGRFLTIGSRRVGVAGELRLQRQFVVDA